MTQWLRMTNWSSWEEFMDLDFDRCYRAVASRDARFDGQFFTAVRTTGIYCRPSCPAITPKQENVSFMRTAAAAQSSGYRACRRCLPDATPGSPLWNVRSDLAARAMRLITDGLVERGGVDALSSNLGYSTRQITRVLTTEVGAGPLALARAHRAHTARQLIQTTTMSMADISFAAGFASIRQFNDTIREVFAVTPTVLRGKVARGTAAVGSTGTLSLRLPYRAPLNAPWIEWFLGGNAVPGIESFHDGEYRRSISLPHGNAIVSLQLDPDYVKADLTLADMRDLGPAVARIRQLLDLDADPVAVDAALASDPRLAPHIEQHPGIRVPGSMDGPELLLRTIIGQQISFGAAVTHTARLVAALGEPMVDPTPGSTITRLFPAASAIAEHGHEILTGPAARVRSVCNAAAAIAAGDVELHSARVPAELEKELLALKGVGPWTARYVSMRQLSDPDVMLDTDLVVRQGAQGLGLDLSDSERWAPWRSYLSMHLWRSALEARRLTKGTKAS